MRILFQGDSITDGNRLKDNHINHQIGHSYAYMVNGYLGLRFPERKYEFINRGISGNTTAELLSRWTEDSLDIGPDLLSLLIGTNDCHAFDDGRMRNGDFGKNLRRLLELSFEKNEKLRVFLLEPFFLPTRGQYAEKKEYWTDIYNRHAEACREIASGDERITYIPLQELFSKYAGEYGCSYWCWDGIHPTEPGHALIARAWLKAFLLSEK